MKMEGKYVKTEVDVEKPFGYEDVLWKTFDRISQKLVMDKDIESVRMGFLFLKTFIFPFKDKDFNDKLKEIEEEEKEEIDKLPTDMNGRIIDKEKERKIRIHYLLSRLELIMKYVSLLVPKGGIGVEEDVEEVGNIEVDEDG